MEDVALKPFKGGVESKLFGRMLFVLYGTFKKRRTISGFIRYLVLKLEGDDVYSITIRRIFAQYHNLHIGMYSHGSCFEKGNFHPCTTVGRYCSIAANVKVFNRNHPMNYKSLHAFFFNPSLKYSKQNLLNHTPLKIGNDVWLGDSVKIMPNVTEIGDGAVIGAGCVITKNIPPYAIVVGYPARIVRYRFPKEVIESLLEEKWWEKDMEEIKPFLHEYQQNYEKLYFQKKEDEAENEENYNK